MLSTSQHLIDIEEKENLEFERKSLLNFKKEAKELLHIEDINTLDLDYYIKQYELNHSNLFKDDLENRIEVIRDFVHFIKNYN